MPHPASPTRFGIHKRPTKVTTGGLVLFGLWVAAAFAFFRERPSFYLVMGGALLVLVMHFVKSIAAHFISAINVTEEGIETVTEFGGIIRVRIDELDRERSRLTDEGLTITPHHGESIILSIVEFSRSDIVRLADHLGIPDTGWTEEV